MGEIYFLKRFSEKRGDLYVIEESDDFSLRYKYYYIIRADHSNIVVKDPMSLLVLKGVVESGKCKVEKGTFISDIYEIGNVSSDFIGLLLSNDRIAELGDVQINPGFEVKRIFFVDNMPVGAISGQHAHKTETELLYVVAGEFNVNIKTESDTFSEILIKGQSVISLPMAWTSVENLTNKGLLLALLSHKYDKSGFII